MSTTFLFRGRIGLQVQDNGGLSVWFGEAEEDGPFQQAGWWKGSISGYVMKLSDDDTTKLNLTWTDTVGDSRDQRYVVETNTFVVERCVLMSSDPGDLVFDPTCGSGTTAAVAEEWGRRWITVDTSRVALALARARVMGARFPYYLLADSEDGLRKQAEVTGEAYVEKPTYGNIRQGFVYERVPHITHKSIANNSEIDVIWEEHQPKVEAAQAALNRALRGHKTPFEVTTGGRVGEAVNFSAPENDTFAMPSGEVVPAFELVEWEVPARGAGRLAEGCREAIRGVLGGAHRSPAGH